MPLPPSLTGIVIVVQNVLAHVFVNVSQGPVNGGAGVVIGTKMTFVPGWSPTGGMTRVEATASVHGAVRVTKLPSDEWNSFAFVAGVPQVEDL